MLVESVPENGKFNVIISQNIKPNCHTSPYIVHSLYKRNSGGIIFDDSHNNYSSDTVT